MRRKNANTDAPDALVRRAMAMRDAGHAAGAVPLVRAALAAQPNNVHMWHVLGLLYRALEDSASAIEAFQNAVRLSAGDAKLNHALARVTMEAGLPAFDLFERAWQLAPGDGSVLLGRAAAQIAEGQAAQAIADIDTILRQNPTWLDGQSLLASMRWMMGDRENFVAGFERALSDRPAEFALWSQLIETLIQAELFGEADDAVRRARYAAGGSRGLDISEAICASELGDADRADRLFAVLRPFQEPALAVRYVRHMLRTGRYREAAAFSEQFIATPDANEIWPYLSLAWRLLGDERWNWLEDAEQLIGIYDLEDSIDLPGLAQRLRALHVVREYMVGQSVRGGTQTDGPLFARVEPEIRALRSLIVATVENHMESLQPIVPTHPVLCHPPGPVRFAGSWSVRLTGEGHHTNHIHPRGWLSSAFYVAVPEKDERGGSPAGWLALGNPPTELGLQLSAFRHIEPKPGRLVLFPSIMWHGTVPFERGERMTVAFDVAAPT